MQARKTNELLCEEVRLFSGTITDNKRKSPLTLLVSPLKNDREKRKILPHKNKVNSPVIPENETGEITLRVVKGNPDLDQYDHILQYMLHLAGIGQRARRGFGAIQWQSHRWESIEEFSRSLKSVLERLEAADRYIWNPDLHCLLKKKDDVTVSHPFLYAVYIGEGKESAKEAVMEIGYASHYGNRKGSLGSSNPRKASPLWCTVRKTGKRISVHDMNRKRGFFWKVWG